MSRNLMRLVLFVGLLSVVGCSSTQPASHGKGQLFKRMGDHRRPITTSSAETQKYFDQGLTWSYAFNHDEAVRSFTRAAELDPECAMAWWGVALCQGPNYNDPKMTEQRNSASWEALQEALARIDNTTPVERALIEALSTRYAKPWPEDRTHLETAYAEAMARVWERFPDDSDVGTLYAEAMMIRRPWKLWTLDYEPAEDTMRIIATLDRVMQIDPNNPGACHLYIHVIEPSTDPSKALGAADRLSDLVPGSGHLCHMPCHIYVQTGDWYRAVEQSEKAMLADDRYRKLSPEQGIQHGYMTHNAHMLAFAAMMTGREREAMAAARDMWADLPPEALEKVGPFLDRWMCSVYDVQKRFGRWDDIIAEPPPPSILPITQATWRACRAVAYAAKKDFVNAEREFELYREAKTRLPEDHPWSRRDLAHTVLDVGEHFIAGEIALQRGEWDLAAEHLEKAAALEDTLSYGEPPKWLQPVRHALGAVYLKTEQFEDAERVYRKDLAKWKDNGWSLYGLSAALRGQGRIDEASDVERQYQLVWAEADAPTTTSCLCIPNP